MREAIPPHPHYAFIAHCSINAKGEIYIVNFFSTELTCYFISNAEGLKYQDLSLVGSVYIDNLNS